MLAAPGVDIVSAGRNGGYRDGTGTSDATAIIAGAAALVRARYPNLSADEVVRRLTATAIDKGPPGRDEQYGYGVIDIVAALTAELPPTAGTPGTTASAPSPATAAPDAGPAGPADSAVPIVLIGLVLLSAAVAALAIARHRRARRP